MANWQIGHLCLFKRGWTKFASCPGISFVWSLLQLMQDYSQPIHNHKTMEIWNGTL